MEFNLAFKVLTSEIMALTKALLDLVYIWCGHTDTLSTYSFASNKKRGHGVNFVVVSNKIRVN
jgi:hypothetical protein